MAKVRSEYEIGLRDDTKRAADSVQRNLTAIRGAALSVTGALSALGVGAGIAGLARIASSAVDTGDRLRDLSKSTGASVEQLSFLSYAASQSGSSIEGLTTGVARLQRNLSEVAKGGGKAASEAFTALGLSAQELARTDIISQLSGIGGALQQVQNPAERAALAQAVFGRGAKELLPLLLEGEQGIAKLADRFVELNGAITGEQADKFDALNDSLGDIKISAQGAGAAIANALAPALTTLFTTIANGTPQVAPFFEFLQNKLRRGFTQLAQDAVRANNAIYEGLQNSLGKLPGFDFSKQVKLGKEQLRTLGFALVDLDKELADKTSTRSKRNAGLRATLGAGGASFGEVGEGSNRAATRAAENLAKAEANAIEQLGRRLVAEQDVTEAARVRYDIEKGAYKEFTAAGQERLTQLANEIDLQKESAEVSEYLRGVEADRRADAEKATTARNDERRKTIESLRTPEEQYAGEVQRLLALDLGSEGLARGIAKAGDALQTAYEAAKDTNDAAEDLGLTFTSAFEDAVIGGESLRNVIQGLGDDILRIALRKTVTEPLGNAISGLFSNSFGEGGGGFGDFFGGLFGNAKGGLYRVGGSGGEHPVAFSARAGEVVAVGTGMSEGGGLHVVVNNYSGANVQTRERTNPNGRRELEVTVGELMTGNIAAGRTAGFGLVPPLAAR